MSDPTAPAYRASADADAPIPDKTERYRARYREDMSSRYRPRLHLAASTLPLLAAAAFCFRALEDVTVLEWFALPVSLIVANAAEYFGHRFPMHHAYWPLRRMCVRHAGEHHRFYTHLAMGTESRRDWHIVLAPPIFIGFFIGLLAVPMGALCFLLLGKNVGLLFVFAASLYALAYEWMHLAYHLPADSWVGRLPFMSGLRQLHLQHHNPGVMAKQNFNITVPLFDALMGTLHARSREDRGPPMAPMG